MTKKTTHFFPWIFVGGNLTANLATLNFRIDRLTPNYIWVNILMWNLSIYPWFFQITKSQHTSPTISPYSWWFEFDRYILPMHFSFDWKLPSFMVSKRSRRCIPHPAVRLAQRLRQAASLGFSDAQEEVQKILSEATYIGVWWLRYCMYYMFFIYIYCKQI